jgi:periplasmic divalent cation tolerance protein
MVQAEGADALVILTTTVASEEEAGILAEAALSARLAACVQEAAIRSRYLWEGEARREPEVRLDFKTLAGAAEALAALLAERHPYDEPEIVVTPVLSASESYAAWVRGSVTASAG